MKNFNPFYKKNAQNYDSGRIDRESEILDLYQTIAELSENKSVCEFGCGTGRYLRPFKEAGWDVMGVDRSSDALNLAPVTKKITHDLTKPLVHTARFGHVILVHVLHQNSPEDIFLILNNARMLLDEEGFIIIKTASEDDLKSRFINLYFESAFKINCKRYPKIAWLKAALDKSGFHSIQSIQREFLVERTYSEIFNSFSKKYNTTLELLSEKEFKLGLDKFQSGHNDGEIFQIVNRCTYLLARKR